MPRICSAHELSLFIDRLRNKIDGQPSLEAFTELDTALEELKIAEETVHEQAESLGKALEKANAERRRYLELFEFAPDGYCVTDPRGVVLEANRAMSELLHYPVERIIGKPLTVFVAQDRRREVRSFIAKVLEPQSNASSHFPVVWQMEFRLRGHNPVPVSVRCSLSQSHTGERPRLLWLIRDITEQKRAEESVQESRHSLERAVEQKTGELQERLAELETFHDVTVDRELRLMALERKLKALEPKDPTGSS
jgi:PAS domain S-box-containing protein